MFEAFVRCRRDAEDIRWESCASLRRLVVELSEDPRGKSTRAKNYETEFAAFFRAFALSRFR
jgi:hypothetical protein